MNKIKKFLSNNKQEIQTLAYGTGMLLIGVSIGRKVECRSTINSLKYLAENRKFGDVNIKGEDYFVSIIKKAEVMNIIKKR